jgi:hypothetical protein
VCVCVRAHARARVCALVLAQVIVDEGINTVSYRLDEALIEFGTCMDAGDFGRAVALLEQLEVLCGPIPSTRTHARTHTHTHTHTSSRAVCPRLVHPQARARAQVCARSKR